MTDLVVIMSIYKQDKLPFVKESVQSILTQTYSNFDYYLIFDGPVCQDIEQYILSIGDSRIKLFRLEKNSGLAVALNALLEVVLRNPDYRYIARMDADDISMPERFEKQKEYLINNPQITILGTWYEEIDESGKILASLKLPTNHDLLRKRYYFMTPFAHSSVMINRRLFEVCGIYPTDANLLEDNFLWGKALSNDLKFANIPEVLLKFRIDRDFYKRRSGFIYGFNFIKIRFKIFKILDNSTFYYVMLLCIGFLRMMPSSVYKFFSTSYIISRLTDRNNC